MMPPTLAELKVLRKYGHEPRLHGNGFLQFDLTPVYRLHIWSRDLPPAQKVSTQLHDHIWDFTSKIVFGKLHDRQYDYRSVSLLHEDDDHSGVYQIWETTYAGGRNTRLVPVRQFIRLEPPEGCIYGIGECYEVKAGVFHQSRPVESPTMTIIEKGAQTTARARVLVPAGTRPDNDFDRHLKGAALEQLWLVLEQTLKLYHKGDGQCRSTTTQSRRAAKVKEARL